MKDSAERYRGLPPPAPFSDDAVIERLGDGLVHRRASTADIEALAAFNSLALAEPPGYEPSPHLAIWVRELAGGEHPRVRVDDFSIVEDVSLHRIASTSSLISHTLCYEGVPFEAGQPEMVATHPDYRRRGLVRLQFEELHRWSTERGQQLQLIDGIPWFYRQFGYEYALEHFEGRRADKAELSQEPAAGELQVRPAAPQDLPFLRHLYERLLERSAVGCARDEASWRYELTARHPMSYGRREIRVVERDGAGPIAAYAHYPILVLDGCLFVTFWEVAPGARWNAPAAAAFAELCRTGEEYARRDGQAFREVQFLLGHQHPLYDEAPEVLQARRAGSGYYVRVPDPVGFVRLVTPALERRLAASKAAGFSGAIEINLFRSGLRLELDAGRLRSVGEWSGSRERPGHVSLPDLCFLQLLFGFRSLAQLCDHFPDAEVQPGPESAAADALFPRRPSPIWLTG